MVSKIEFGEPCLREVRLVRKYELEGVAFAEGYEKSVSFTFHSGHSGNLSLRIEDVYQAKEVYDLFRELLGKAGMNKSMGWLFVEWNVSGTNREAMLLNIEKSMSTEWKDAFRAILSVYDK